MAGCNLISDLMDPAIQVTSTIIIIIKLMLHQLQGMIMMDPLIGFLNLLSTINEAAYTEKLYVLVIVGQWIGYISTEGLKGLV